MLRNDFGYLVKMKKIFFLFLGLIFLSACLSNRNAVEAIRDGGEWFLGNQDESFIYYQYDPETDTHPDKHHSAREFGALWSITKLAGFLNDSRYNDLALRGWEHFSKTFELDELNHFIYVNITPSKIKLSYNAFAILVLLELESEPLRDSLSVAPLRGVVEGKDAVLEQLANGILYAQADSGELDTFYYSDRATGTDYYPGQALLALMSLYEAGGNENYLDAVAKALPYYSKTYWTENPNTAFVPWQTQAYYKYYLATGSQEAADFVFAMNDFMIDHFAEDEACDSFDTDSGIVMAVYVEGMNKAYALAQELGDEERKKCYGEFIRAGSAAVMALQDFNEALTRRVFGSSPSVSGGDAAFGGFHGSLRDFSMQVDRNQHAVMALMGAYELGLVK